MKITDILAVAGKPGLYQVLASGSASIVVESMVDGKRSSVPGTARVSNLADITMYTHDDDVPLLDILNRMHDTQKGAEGPSHKDAAQTIRDFVDGIVTANIFTQHQECSIDLKQGCCVGATRLVEMGLGLTHLFWQSTNPRWIR